MSKVPRIFISYSHDSERHKAWVLNLSTRLMANRVYVILDQWDVKLGSDIAKFIEQGLFESDRIIMICTENYVEKANSGKGGVGYEKTIMTAELMRDLDSNKIIPLLKNNDKKKTPTFIGERKYVDFNLDTEFEDKYEELIRDIPDVPLTPKPPLGANPFLKNKQPEIKPLKFQSGSEKYVSASLRGKVTFDYSNNNGNYIIGAGDLAFETHWSKAGDTSIWTYKFGHITIGQVSQISGLRLMLRRYPKLVMQLGMI
ncbi:MAG: toll/interleukin-1 receptor domain-containing protein [Planctomycetota bacterium]